jgi:hypothetical protein
MLSNVSVTHKHYKHSCEEAEIKAVSWTNIDMNIFKPRKMNPNNFWHLEV